MAFIKNTPIATENCRRVDVQIGNQGTVTGCALRSPRSKKELCHRFCGIPYSLSVDGENRFKRPRKIPEDFDYTGEYIDFKLKCPQPASDDIRLGYIKSPSDENITYLNISVPASDKFKPKDGWPVLIYIHGGWLQNGSPSSDAYNAMELFDDEETRDKFILVTPGYRLNIFGFLSCEELLKEDSKGLNVGFWDQRFALEWVHDNIKYFGGNSEKLTLSGLSAGAYSTFFQLAYELYHQEESQLIKQVIFFSNCLFVQPKTLSETQEQFEEVCAKLAISSDLAPEEKLTALRKIDAGYLEDIIPELRMHTFRAVTDGEFVPPTLLQDILSGEYAQMLKAKGVRLMCGDVSNEGLTYSVFNPPTSLPNLIDQVENYYPKKVVDSLLEVYDVNQISNPAESSPLELSKLYGKIVADGQVYASLRGFLDKIINNGFPQQDVFRYRVSFRPKYVDEFLAPNDGVPHGCDTPIWFYSLRDGYNEEEITITRNWLKPYLSFLNFNDYIDGWSSADIKKIRWFKQDGSIEYEADPDWDRGVKVANVAYMAQV
ncbi:LAMI_0D00320g1_1 [Lachancea mirantina]|uniref:Carboxylic ester hydrolase n=1 Tax=Lachancea mirantina TaxID=1230905 RepID=A0A1G4J827_9SACH|nr:LAMI_0D00320g1_1 [Lachancea mirantina]